MRTILATKHTKLALSRGAGLSTAVSFRRRNRVHLNRPGLGVQRAYDPDLLRRKFLRRLLIAQRIDFLAVK